MKQIRLVLVLGVILVFAGRHPQLADAYGTLVPNDDIFVRDKVGERDTNFDQHTEELHVTAEGFPLGDPVDIVYLRFDVSSFGGSVIDSATLRLYGQYNAPSMILAVFSTVSDDWNGGADGMGDQTTLTFNNAPEEDIQLDSAITSTGSPGWWEFTGPQLRTYVEDQLPDNGGDGYITLRVRAVSTGIADIQNFEDREDGGGSGNSPQLVLLGEPTGVTLASFTATPGEDEILIEWETASEPNLLGFNLFRAESSDGYGNGTYLQLNDTLIERTGDPISGGSYSFPDREVVPGVRYYYWLEYVTVGGTAKLHGPVDAAVAGYEIYLPLVARW